jgi:hypothetical protein
MNITLSPRDLAQLALDASLDLRTVVRGLAGMPMRHGARGRLQAALASRGIELPLATALTANYHTSANEGEDR